MKIPNFPSSSSAALPLLLTLLLLGSTIVVVTGQETCTNSDDCLDTEYCASGGTCVGIGNCTTYTDCFNPNNFPYPVLACVGYLDCSSDNICGMVCGLDQCPNGEDPVECDESNLPCDTTTCDEADIENGGGCYNDKCGGSCTAVFFDPAGNVVCTDATEPTDSTDVPCTTDADCLTADGGDGSSPMFCAKGVCLNGGKCQDVVDCYNPSNLYAVIECVGPLTCDDTGSCGRVCGPACEDGTDGTACFANPCDTVDLETCDGNVVSCVADYCHGGCDTILFDSAGFTVASCTNDTDPAVTNATTPDCVSDGDCAENEYCASGNCLEHGACKDLFDCFNPSNGPYAVAACVGYTVCDGGLCGIVCSNAFCPEGQAQVDDCGGLCNVTDCDEAVSCYEYNCGGCTKIHFDEAGYQVCGDDDNNTTALFAAAGDSCSADDDCLDGTDKMYCAQGVCTPVGWCIDPLDCFNPSNTPYSSIYCAGYMNCTANQCGMVCGEQQCANGEEYVGCDPENLPCNDTSTCPEAAGCYNDPCGGGQCSAVYFDEAGNIICQGTPMLATSENGVADTDGAVHAMSLFSAIFVSAIGLLVVQYL